MKRGLDLIVAVVALLILAPLIALIAATILVKDGRPVFYVSERMKTPDHPFLLFKFRTMSPPRRGQLNAGVSGGDKTNRITPFGAFLRRIRLDEIPQLLNVVKGDMSLVGPRPPLRQYTEQFPKIYQQVLMCRPGMTGLATLHFHHREERLLSVAKTPEETERIYVTRCLSRKARLDLIYARHAGFFLDVTILYRTASMIWPRRKPSAALAGPRALSQAQSNV